MLGSDLYFFGFPYGMVTFGEAFPGIPFVKKGTLSAIDSSDKSRMVFYLDGHNNPGFSGGPIYFWDASKQQSRFAGVVSAYRGEWVEILSPKEGERRQMGQIPLQELNKTGKFVPTNTGIVVGYDIKHAVDAIRKRPIRMQLR